ncbi:uncharacterized protein ASPGLDRAFT_31797 [Aspergillus glaucus CBS 516.65]|uniref:Uncharacterized protein n=1 Tax=Aspergillus glaucus CBS 516.65 TaxID=1160497 RepID=A0A1L9VXS4_ASPGL|nr:hypothetical protein ASPGLDRAFT_31797 [Aspergillus glaucus CBS 516.65]OJJ88677.1 hypothetical protein ASPGLDRAFT_31797 [Aspergillus glaucus CBS 516.65]
MHNLVVCSATDPNDPTHSAMFSDFKKISSMLMPMETQTAMGNIFLSCFQLEERLNCLSMRTTPTTETKSGRPESSSGLGPVFTDHDRIHHKQVQEEAKLAGTSPNKDGAFHDEVVGWIKQKTQEAQPGDMVNLFFFKATDSPKASRSAKKVINNNDSVPLLQRFCKGVQVNAVRLYSNRQFGKLVDAIRHDKWHNGRMTAGERHGQCRFATTRRLSGMFKDLANSKRPHTVVDPA